MLDLDMLKAATSSVVHDDAFTAGKDVMLELLSELGRAPDLVLLFASSKYDLQRVLDGIHSHLPEGTPLVGCSSYAEIDADEALTASVTAMGLVLQGVEIRTFEVAGRPDSASAGREAGDALRDFKPALILAFPDVLELNATRFLLGLQEAVGKEIPIVGGASADAGAFLRTHQIHGRRLISGGAVGVALKGPIELATAARSGYMPVGATHASTRVVDGNVVLEIDGRPALDLYRDYLRERAAEMPAVSIEFPIGVVGGILGTQRQSDDSLLLVRAVFKVDEARGALILGGDIPEGAEIRVTRATKQDIVRGAEEATDRALEALPRPDLALIFSCMSRKSVLGLRFKDECRASFARLPEGLPKAGFYTFGELSPVQGVTMHHESTYTIVLLKAAS
jgi:hypothetical protein